jgi:hypothetical protein
MKKIQDKLSAIIDKLRLIFGLAFSIVVTLITFIGIASLAKKGMWLSIFFLVPPILEGFRISYEYLQPTSLSDKSISKEPLESAGNKNNSILITKEEVMRIEYYFGELDNLSEPFIMERLDSLENYINILNKNKQNNFKLFCRLYVDFYTEHMKNIIASHPQAKYADNNHIPLNQKCQKLADSICSLTDYVEYRFIIRNYDRLMDELINSKLSELNQNQQEEAYHSFNKLIDDMKERHKMLENALTESKL